MNDDRKNTTLNDAENQALFFHHAQKESDWQERRKELDVERRELKKNGKNDGVDWKLVEFAIKARKNENRDKVISQYSGEAQVLEWLGYPIGHQTDLFADRSPKLEQVEREGKREGLLAGSKESGYGPNSPEDVAYKQGYASGQAILANNLQSAMEKRNAAKAEAKQPDELMTADDEDPFGEEAA